MTPPPDSIHRLHGQKADGTLSSTTIDVEAVQAVSRSAGLWGDTLSLVAKADDLWPGDWEIARPMSFQFGDSAASVTLGGYMLQSVSAYAAGSPIGGGTPVTRMVRIDLITIPGWMRNGRGGVLSAGTLNELGEDGLFDTGADSYNTLTELATACFDAITEACALWSLDYATLPAAFDTLSPGGPYDWGNAHAIHEVEPLLARVGYITCLSNDGATLRAVRLPRAGETPSLPSIITDNAEPYDLVSAPSVRGSIFIVTSGRTRTTVLTYRVIEDLEYVYFDDRTGAWLNQTEHAALYPTEIGPGSLTALNAAPPADEKKKMDEFSRLLSALRISDSADRAATRRFVSIANATEFGGGVTFAGAVGIETRCAMMEDADVFIDQPPDGLDDPIFIPGVRAVPGHGVFVLPRWGKGELILARVVTDTCGGWGDLRLLNTDDEFKLFFAHESDTGDILADYFVAAFEADEDGVVTQITEISHGAGAVEAALRDPSAVVVDAEWLRRVVRYDPVGDTTTALNDTTLLSAASDAAEIKAGALLAQSGQIPVRGLRNIAPGDASGAVTRVTWLIEQRITLVEINTHERPESELAHAMALSRMSFESGVLRWYQGASSAANADVRSGSGPGSGAAALGGAGGGGASSASSSGGRGAERSELLVRSVGAESSTPGGRGGFGFIIARITGNSANGDNRWAMQWTEVRPGTSKGSWVDVATPRTHETHGLAYPTMDTANTDTVTPSNNVDRANLPVDWAMVPIGTGAVVLLMGPFLDSEGERWMAIPNVPNFDDGPCEEPPA